jgi:hypothetical protein
MRASTLIQSLAVVLAGALACGSVDGPWGICAAHGDATSCQDDGCLWLLAPAPDDACAQPVDGYTPIAKDGCFKDWNSAIRDRVPGCSSDAECEPGARCVAKSFLAGAFNPSCEHYMLCVVD